MFGKVVGSVIAYTIVVVDTLAVLVALAKLATWLWAKIPVWSCFAIIVLTLALLAVSYYRAHKPEGR